MGRVLLMFCLVAGLAHAGAGYRTETVDAFMARVFAGQVPNRGLLWLDDDLQARALATLGHPYAGRRLRYWHLGERTAWVIEEVGMKAPITLGIAVNAGQVHEVSVLVYRESRGGEVGQRDFLSQFDGARLRKAQALDRDIDGITGATLSVGSVTRATRWALALHDVLCRDDQALP